MNPRDDIITPGPRVKFAYYLIEYYLIDTHTRWTWNVLEASLLRISIHGELSGEGVLIRYDGTWAWAAAVALDGTRELTREQVQGMVPWYFAKRQQVVGLDE